MNRMLPFPARVSPPSRPIFLLAPMQAHPANIEAQNYQRAFALVENGHPEQALTFAAHGRDPVLNKVIRGYYLAQPGNDASFAETAAFITRNPDWPGLRGILAIAEQKIPAGATPEQVIGWFNDHLPVSLIGFYRYVDALNAVERTQTASALIRARWIDGDFTPQDEQTAFAARFPRFVDSDAHWARLDRLLWKNDSTGARRMYPYVDEGMKAVAEARHCARCAATQRRAAWPRMFRPNGRTIRAFCMNGCVGMCAIIATTKRWISCSARPITSNIERGPERWWEQRQILLRRLMDRRDYATAPIA